MLVHVNTVPVCFRWYLAYELVLFEQDLVSLP